MATEEPNFNFPFQPYPAQLTFMKTLYRALEDGKVGIFESPTGTGKSLSIICASLAWLKEFNGRSKASLEAEIAELTRQISVPVPVGVEDDWITRDAENILRRCRLRDAQVVRDALSKKEKKYEDLKEKAKRKREPYRIQERADFSRKDVDSIDKELVDITQLLSHQKEAGQEDEVPDYHSDDEETHSDEDDDPSKDLPFAKIIYCSRTHSQLSQFVKELKKTVYGENTRTVSLASRNNLCINEAVTKLASLSLMNDKCLDMQKKPSPRAPVDMPNCKRAKRSESAKCPFYRQQAMEGLANDILVEVQDIEQVVHRGERAKACPYYSSRYATPDAELVLIPYNILLQKSARDACKLVLKGNVVIIDEAHNLLDTINSTHSVELRSSNIAEAHQLLNEYFNRYRSRMNTKNVMYIKQILFILRSFMTLLSGGKANADTRVSSSAMSTVHVFLVNAGISNMNLFKIQRYLERSKISLKLRLYSKKTSVAVSKQPGRPKASNLSAFIGSLKTGGLKNVETLNPLGEEPQQTSTSSSPLSTVEAFIRALNCTYDDGRVLVTKAGDTSSSFLKYVLLNPSNYFMDVVSQARAIILAGGTMEPTGEFVDQLLIPAGVQRKRIIHFACGHVVPKTNLCAMALSQGPSGKTLEFTYQNRGDAEMVQDLGNLLVNVTRVVPGGVVCFFPSYEYEKVVSEKWKSSGLVEKLAARKQIFREPAKSSELDKTLTLYSQRAKTTGALLFAVVGGKMSEGINFSDDMGRCIVMVGLPFPNARSPEMKSKIDFLNSNYPQSDDGRSAGQVYYDNVCMKAVNQSIGRAIRHKDDYAIILLLDQRYQRPTISKALPSWIQDSLTAHTKFGTAFAAIQHFFRVDRTASD